MTTPSDQMPEQPPVAANQNLGKFLIPILVILALVVGGLFVVKYQVTNQQPKQEGQATVQVGSVLPDFELQRFGGEKVKLSSVPGKVLLVNFWATWCEACVVEMPSIVALRNKYKDKGFDVVGINVDENPDAVLPKSIKQLKIDFPVYTDASGTIADLFDVHAIPLTAVIDKSRKVLLLENGERNWDGDDIHSMMDKWLTQ